MTVGIYAVGGRGAPELVLVAGLSMLWVSMCMGISGFGCVDQSLEGWCASLGCVCVWTRLTYKAWLRGPVATCSPPHPHAHTHFSIIQLLYK